MKFKHIIALALIITMALSTAVACSQNTDDPVADTTTAVVGQDPAQTNGDTSTTAPVETTVPTEEQLARPEATDAYRGYEFSMLVTTNALGSTDLYFSSTDGYTGAAVSDALYARKAYLNEAFGLDLKVNLSTTAKNDLNVALQAGEYLCDASFLSARDSFSIALNGYYRDLNDLDSLNTQNSYWDQRIQNEYLIGDKLFFLEGDHTIVDELRTYVCIYNDNLYRDYGYYDKYGTPYEMVSSGTWTYDRLMTMTADMYRDLNDNGLRDDQDFYGMVGELTCGYYFFLGSGLKLIDNENGSPRLCISDDSMYERIYNALADTMEMTVDPDILMPQLLEVSDVWGAASAIFEQDHAIFRSTSLSAVTRLVDMSGSYGILPIPKYTEAQDGYYCWVSGNNHFPLCIPNTVQDAEKSAAIAEILCYYSRYGSNTLYDAFYEVMKISKICRQSEDVAMLDLVFNSKTFDLDYSAQITGIESSMYSLAKSGNLSSLNSTIKSLRRTADASLKRFLSQIDK